MAEQIVRELVDGEWTTTFEEGGGAGSDILTLKTTVVTAAELLTIASQPVTLIPAPASGKIIVPVFATSQWEVTTPYADPDGTNIFYGSAAGRSVVWGLIDLTAATSWFEFLATNNTQGQPKAGFVDQPIVLAGTGADPTGGDATFTIGIYYTIVTPS